MECVRSPSAKRGCRHYVNHYLHRNVNPEKVWIIDAALEGDVDLHVSTHIRHPQEKHKVFLFRVLGRLKSRYKTSSQPNEQAGLAASVCAAARLATRTVPAVLRVMQDMEGDAVVMPVGGMLGDGDFARVTNTMDVSVDLSNTSHYDLNNASQSFSIWTEDAPCTTRGWYFVLPNVFGKKTAGGCTFNGVAIKLTHGTLISWDGRLIRHCTSMMDRKQGCHVYGTFFGAKTSVVHYGVQRAITTE